MPTQTADQQDNDEHRFAKDSAKPARKPAV